MRYLVEIMNNHQSYVTAFIALLFKLSYIKVKKKEICSID